MQQKRAGEKSFSYPMHVTYHARTGALRSFLEKHYSDKNYAHSNLHVKQGEPVKQATGCGDSRSALTHNVCARGCAVDASTVSTLRRAWEWLDRQRATQALASKERSVCANRDDSKKNDEQVNSEAMKFKETEPTLNTATPATTAALSATTLPQAGSCPGKNSPAKTAARTGVFEPDCCESITRLLDVVEFIGPSGCGKSTLARALFILVRTHAHMVPSWHDPDEFTSFDKMNVAANRAFTWDEKLELSRQKGERKYTKSSHAKNMYIPHDAVRTPNTTHAIFDWRRPCTSTIQLLNKCCTNAHCTVMQVELVDTTTICGEVARSDNNKECSIHNFDDNMGKNDAGNEESVMTQICRERVRQRGQAHYTIRDMDTWTREQTYDRIMRPAKSKTPCSDVRSNTISSAKDDCVVDDGCDSYQSFSKRYMEKFERHKSDYDDAYKNDDDGRKSIEDFGTDETDSDDDDNEYDPNRHIIHLLDRSISSHSEIESDTDLSPKSIRVCRIRVSVEQDAVTQLCIVWDQLRKFSQYRLPRLPVWVARMAVRASMDYEDALVHIHQVQYSTIERRIYSKPIMYASIKLHDNNEVLKLLPKPLPDALIVQHEFHVTNKYFANDPDPLYLLQLAKLCGTSVTVNAKALVWDCNGMALVVSNHKATEFPCSNPVPHITIANDRFTFPVYSNELCENLNRSIRGRRVLYMKKGTTVDGTFSVDFQW